MNKARKFFLTTTASLAILFTGYALSQSGPGGNVAAAPPDGSVAATSLAPPAVSGTAASPLLATILQDYNTQASKDLKRESAAFNSSRPAGTAPIVSIDWDKVATWYGMPEGPSTVAEAIGDYLTATTGRSYDAQTLELLARAMNGKSAEGIVTQSDGGACLIVPEYPGISFDSFYAASFKVGAVDALAGKTPLINMSTPEFTSFVNAHERWHCLDIRYIKDTGDGLEGAVKRNRTEMFADIGGAAEAIQNGADLSLIDKAVALRGAWAYLTGPAQAKTPEENGQHYESIVYTTQGGLLALKARIETMGLDNFRKLDREQLRALDYELTDAHSVTYAEAQGLQAFYTTGKTSAAARPLITQLKDIAAASVRTATPAELAAREANAAAAATNGGLTEQALVDGLKTRAAALGSATSLSAQLKARAEMTDSLRSKLNADPASEAVTEAQLKLVLYANPHLVPRK